MTARLHRLDKSGTIDVVYIVRQYIDMEPVNVLR